MADRSDVPGKKTKRLCLLKCDQANEKLIKVGISHTLKLSLICGTNFGCFARVEFAFPQKKFYFRNKK